MKLRFRLNKKYLVDDFIFVLIIFQIMAGNLLGITNMLSIVLLALIIISCIQNITYYIGHAVGSIILFLIIILIYPFYSFVRFSGDIHILLNNIFYIITPMAMLLYIDGCCNRKGNYLRDKFLKLLPLLNGYAILNVFIMLIQCVVNRNRFSNKIEYMDSISGLFGKYGTPIIAIFVSFIVVYDLLLLKQQKSKILRMELVTILISNIILAALNDNKAFYLILLLFPLFLWFAINYEHAIDRNSIQRIIKMSIRIGALFVLGILLLQILINYTFVGEYYNRIIHEITIGWEKTNLVQGSNERFGMISFALQNMDTRYFGYGLGTSIWKQESMFGFAHFGQNDIGVFLILGGVIFVISLTLYFYLIFHHIFKRKIISLLAVVVLLILGIYTQIFTSISMMGCVILYILVCWFALLLERKTF